MSRRVGAIQNSFGILRWELDSDIKNRQNFIAVIIIFIIVFAVIHYKSGIDKESIIKSFNENYKSFSDVEKYISQRNSSASMYKSNNDVVFSRSEQRENSNIPLVKDQVTYILNKLRFEKILKKDGPALEGVIVFQRTSGDFEQGIVYLKDDSGKYGMEMVKIRDRWYYYSIGHV